MKKVVKIAGMSCDHCLRRVQNALSSMNGVSDIRIDLKEGTAAFSGTDSLEDEGIREVIEDAGYDVVSIENMD